MVSDIFIVIMLILNILICLYITQKKYRFKNQNLILYINLAVSILIMFSASFHKGYKEDYILYFAAPAVINGFSVIAFGTNRIIKDIVFSLIIVAICSIAVMLFWSYMDRPWFSKGPEFINGESQYGWFSFENNLYGYEIPVIGSIAIGLGLLIRKISLKLNNRHLKS